MFKPTHKIIGKNLQHFYEEGAKVKFLRMDEPIGVDDDEKIGIFTDNEGFEQYVLMSDVEEI